MDINNNTTHEQLLFGWLKTGYLPEMESVKELQSKIDYNASRLEELPPGAESKRIKKRILQTLGKLKKQLSEAKEREINEPPVKEGFSANLGSRKQQKAKLKIINNEIAEYARKKQVSVI